MLNAIDFGIRLGYDRNMGGEFLSQSSHNSFLILYTMKLKDLLNKKLENLKLQIDSNHQQIQDCDQLLSTIKQNCNELDSLANKISR